MSDPTFRFWYSDAAMAGESLVAILLDGENRAWDAAAGAYAAMPRTSGMDVPLAEVDGLPGTFRPTGSLPTIGADQTILVRVEQASDHDHIPIAAKSFASRDVLVRITWDDILDLIVPGSGVDGRADDSLLRVILELQSFGLGGRPVTRSRDARGRRVLHGGPLLANTNEQIRRMIMVLADPLVAATMPPDAFQ